MHMRRALLLFAIVLGLAALATSISPPPPRDSREGAAPELREPRPVPDAGMGSEPLAIRLSSVAGPASRRIPSGTRAVVTVSVVSPGEVAVPALDLLEPAEPGTPAVFDLLPTEPGRYAVSYTPVGGAPRGIGELVVTAPERGSPRSSAVRR